MIDSFVESGQAAILPVRIKELRLDAGFIYLRERQLSPTMHEFMQGARRMHETKMAIEDELAAKYQLAG
jgi:hypothetical protein